MAQPFPCHVLLLGDLSSAELLPVVAHVRGRIRHGHLREAQSVAQAILSYRPGSSPPELIIACQSWSDQFSPADIQRLMRWQPLAQLICCYGPWCDSDGRTRDAWPFSVRVAAEDAVRHVEFVLGAQDRRGTPLAATQESAPVTIANFAPLPWTASRTEVFASRFGVARRHSGKRFQPISPGSIVVDSADQAWRQMIVNSFHPRVLTSGDARSHSGNSGRVKALIWDADPAEASRLAELIELRTSFPQFAVVAAVGFPRADLAGRLQRAGADRVWAKLTPLETLHEIVCELLQSTGPRH